ncbi:MAG: heme exporter protein CcmD [Rhodospirillales bacterium]|nr:heme exporter protein CcmD [Rhodospirillales bacterium]
MDSITTFLNMGGYAAYIWPSYGIVAAVLVGLLFASLRGLRSEEATLKALEATGSADDQVPKMEKKA